MILREKILLGLVGVAAVGAGVVYAPALFNPSVEASTRASIDFPTLISKVQLSLKEGESTDREKQILAAVSTKWLSNPLRSRPLVIEEQPEPVDAPPAEYLTPLPEYIGFLNIGEHVIAIINGQDYRPGETIEGGEFQLMKILPDHIKLLRRGASDPVNVPLEKPFVTGKSEGAAKLQASEGASGSGTGAEPAGGLAPPPVQGAEVPPAPALVPGVEIVPLPVQVIEGAPSTQEVPSTREPQ